MTRTRADLEEELKRLKQENAILKEAADFDSATIASLRKGKGVPDPEEVTRLKEQLDGLNIDLMAMNSQMQRQFRELEDFRTSAHDRRWRFLTNPEEGVPEIGQHVFVLALKFKPILEGIRDCDHRISTEVLMKNAIFTYVGGIADFKGIEPGWVTLAWMPVSETSWEQVGKAALDLAQSFIGDNDAFEYQIGKSKKFGDPPELLRKEKLFQGAKKTLEKYEYQPGATLSGVDMIFTARRKG